MTMNSKKKVVAIIQARMNSSRLPGKVLLPIAGKEMLSWVINRTMRAKLVDEVIVATSEEPSDQPIVDYCLKSSYLFSRGSLFDVLDRYYQTAVKQKADVVVRITADCPFIDPEMLDSNIETFIKATPPLDFAANRLPNERSIPIGLDTEICTIHALTKAWNETTSNHHREHVMPYFYENSDIFNILHIKYSPDYGNLRWTVDTSEDLILVNKIAEHFSGNDNFSWKDVLTASQQHPEWATINNSVVHKDYREVDKRK